MAETNEILFEGRLRIPDPAALFSRYQVTQKDLKRYERLIREGKEDRAINEFVEKYMVDVSELYMSQMQKYLEAAESGEMTRREQQGMSTSVALLTAALITVYKNNFKTFVSEALAPTVFQKFDIRTPAVKKSILDATVAEFNTLIQGAMSQTQTDILNHIRTMQREMIIQNQSIRKKIFITGALDTEVKLFRDSLRAKYPDFYKAMEKGQILKDRAGRAWRLDKYAGMATRTTILNVERTSVEVLGKIDKDRFIEYYQRDFRTLKTGKEREVCKEILAKKIEGRSLLAYDKDTARRLGIMTIDQARARGAMGPYCRHSIRPVSRTYTRKVERKFWTKEELSNA